MPNLDTSDVSNMTRMFDECTALTALDLSNFNTEEVRSMLDMFLFCTSLTSLDLKSFNTKNVNDMRGMFRGSSSLNSLDLASLDMSNVSQMGGMFKDISLVSLTLGDAFKFDNPNSNLRKPRAIVSVSDLNREGKYLTDNWIKKEDSSLVYTTADFMANYGKGDLKAGTYVAEIKPLIWGDAPYRFDSNTGVLTINSGTLGEAESAPWNKTDNSKVAGEKIKKIVFTGETKAPVNATALFKSLKNLTEIEALPNLDTSDVSNMSRMFEGCSALTTLDLSNFNTEKVTSMLDMFLFCGSLTTLDLKSFNTKNVTDMRGMFRACSSLKSLNLSNFDTSNGSLMGGMFTETVLSSLTLGDKFKFRGDGINLPEPAALATGDKLTGKWIKMNRGSYPHSPNGFMREYGKKDLTAGTYVAEIKAPLLWGDAPYTFDKNTGVLTVESGRLSKSDASPWNKEGDEKIAGEKIKKIVFTAATKAPEDSTDLFKDLNNLTEIAGLTNLDTSEVTSMYNLFRDCSSLMTFDISNFSTSKLTNTRDMFRGCTSLLTLDLSTFNTKNVNDMRGMFRTCTSLNTLDISALDTSSVSTLMQMFEDVPLTSLTLGDNFRFVNTDSYLSLLQEKSKLAALREGNCLSGNWIKKDNPSPVYTTDDFTTNYGKTAGLQAGTYVAETKPVFWGDAPYAFDSDTGVLTVSPGTLDVFANTPWIRDDFYKINSDQIKKIVFTGENKAPENCNSLFSNLISLKEIVGLDKLDTSGVFSMANMFLSCTMLEKLDLSSFDTSKVNIYFKMFYNCKNLKSLDISSFNSTSNPFANLPTKSYVFDMFKDCTSLASLTLGDKFALHNIMELSDPKVLHSWERPTGNWIRKDGNSKAYSTKNFVANYGKGDLTAGTYIAEVKPIKWGSALWTFDPDSGILTVNSGTLEAGATTSPWKRTDRQNIDPNSVKQIVFTGKTQAPKNSEALFSDLPNLTDIVNLTNLDTSKVTDMSRMFIGCKSLKTLDLSQFNTSNVTKTEWMFQDCASLTELNLKSFDTSKLTKMWMMFSGCASLTSIDLSNFDTKNVVTMGKLFYGCSSLTSVNLSSFDTSQVTHMGEMFQNCTSLTSLDLSSFDTGKVTTMQKLFKNTPLASLTLGVKFKSVGRDTDLPIPTALNDGDKLTGNWIRKDGQSKAYSPENFMANYGKGDLKAGTYVGELIYGGAVLETTISFSTDSGKTAATTADIGDKLQGKITVKHTADSPKDAIASVIKLSTISLLTDAWAVSPTVTVTTFDQDGKQTATKAQTIKDNELSLPALPFDSYIEITITGTAWEKAYAIPNGNYHYTLSHQNQFGVQKVEKSDNFVINSGAFGFKSVPNISFTDSILPIKSNQFIDRKDTDYAISVTDYRGTRLPDGETVKPDRVNWEITATASPFKDATGKTIKLSTMAVSFTKAIGKTTELGADATLITSHDVTGETAKDNHLTKLSWAKELGFKAIVHNRSGLDTTKYTADVEFDLRTAP
ncbi:BspA family leucine-rich repeat surface protein [Lactococcus piscium]|nr:BspA family leucine-rich repeat surface protein [Lactococcus piscium]